MINKQYILFDFDGTLADSSEGVFGSVIYALKKLGEPIPSPEQLRTFIGPPLLYSFEHTSGLSKERAQEAVDAYREDYATGGVHRGRLYDGIEDMLRTLKEAGRHLAVATSKPEAFAEIIMSDLKIDKYFELIAGAEFSGTRTDKPAVIKYALERLGIDPSEALMVGDRFHDVEGAHAFGIPCIGVLWGFGSREEFMRYDAEHICHSPAEVTKLILS